MDRSEYIDKMKNLLEDIITYRPLNMDPANKQKNKLINILRRIKTESGMEDTNYRMITLLDPVHQNYMGFQRYIRRNTP